LTTSSLEDLEGNTLCENLVHIATTIGKLQHLEYLKPPFLDIREWAIRPAFPRDSHIFAFFCNSCPLLYAIVNAPHVRMENTASNFSSTQTVVIFSDQALSKCSYI